MSGIEVNTDADGNKVTRFESEEEAIAAALKYMELAIQAIGVSQEYVSQAADTTQDQDIFVPVVGDPQTVELANRITQNALELLSVFAFNQQR